MIPEDLQANVQFSHYGHSEVVLTCLVDGIVLTAASSQPVEQLRNQLHMERVIEQLTRSLATRMVELLMREIRLESPVMALTGDDARKALGRVILKKGFPL